MTTQQPGTTQPAPGPSTRPKIIGAVAVLAVLVLIAGVVVFAGSDDAAAGEIFVEPLGSTGPDPFTDRVAPEPVATLADYAAKPAADPDVDPGVVPEGVSPDPVPAESVRALVEAAEGASVPLLVGTRPGVYGGTRDEASCDADQLVAFLAAEDAKAEAWAGVHDIDVAVWGLGVETHPNRVTCFGQKNFFDDDQQFPDTQYAVCEYSPAGKSGKGRQLIFEQRIWSPYVQEGYENGAAFYGTQGVLIMGHTIGWKLYGPKNKLLAEQTGPTDLPAHHQNFIDAIRDPAVATNA